MSFDCIPRIVTPAGSAAFTPFATSRRSVSTPWGISRNNTPTWPIDVLPTGLRTRTSGSGTARSGPGSGRTGRSSPRGSSGRGTASHPSRGRRVRTRCIAGRPLLAPSSELASPLGFLRGVPPARGHSGDKYKDGPEERDRAGEVPQRVARGRARDPERLGVRRRPARERHEPVLVRQRDRERVLTRGEAERRVLERRRVRLVRGEGRDAEGADRCPVEVDVEHESLDRRGRLRDQVERQDVRLDDGDDVGDVRRHVRRLIDGGELDVDRQRLRDRADAELRPHAGEIVDRAFGRGDRDAGRIRAGDRRIVREVPHLGAVRGERRAARPVDEVVGRPTERQHVLAGDIAGHGRGRGSGVRRGEPRRRERGDGRRDEQRDEQERAERPHRRVHLRVRHQRYVITPTTSAIAGTKLRRGTTQSGRFDGGAPTEGPVTVTGAEPFVVPGRTLAVGTGSTVDAAIEPLTFATEPSTWTEPTGRKMDPVAVRFTKYVAFVNAPTETYGLVSGAERLRSDAVQPSAAIWAESGTVSSTFSPMLPLLET